MKKLLFVFVPSFITFGPIFMVLGSEHLLRLFAAVALGIGLVAIFRMVMQQRQEIEELRRRLDEVTSQA